MLENKTKKITLFIGSLIPQDLDFGSGYGLPFHY
jgi:hypothetical protein